MKKMTSLLSCALLLALPEVGAQESNPMLSNGLKLLNTPYVAYTLEGNSEEELVVNCDEVDCTTFVENVLAMALCPTQGEQMSEADFMKNLQNIRYRNGQINGYTSRLHYMTDWINDNVQKGLIEDVAAQYSPSTQTVNLSFMSSHPELYKQLNASPEKVAEMASIEQRLSGQQVHWVPKDMLPAQGLPWIKNGDIIAITTNTPGLDISHLGIAIYIKDQLHLLHASSKQKKVVVEKLALSRQLAGNKTWTGIRVLRMKSIN